MKLYEYYCNCYDASIAVVAKMRERPLTNQFLQGVMQSDTSSSSLPLEALLIMPVQRLPRYMYVIEHRRCLIIYLIDCCYLQFAVA
jgi:hypothetical protein